MSGASMPLDRRRALGSFGELAALAHLRRRGATLLAQNWRCRLGEIDLVARLGDQILFVEVKTRTVGALAPESGVGPAKARRLAQLAYTYLEEAGLPATTGWRIDLVAVEVDGTGRVVRLEHMEGVVSE